MSANPSPTLGTDDYDYYDDRYDCQRCGGEGWIMARDADPSDWGEDTYCGPEDATMVCPDCRGKGVLI